MLVDASVLSTLGNVNCVLEQLSQQISPQFNLVVRNLAKYQSLDAYIQAQNTCYVGGYMRSKNSFLGLLSRSPDAGAVQLERIRVEMLNALAAQCDENHCLSLEGALRFASDLEALWYLRPDLLHAIATSKNQSTANIILRDITLLFKGHLHLASSSQFGQLE
jgi:hypothetical protein